MTTEPERRLRVFERELWRIAVEYLFPDEQHAWAALAGARVAANGWRRAKATLHHDPGGELRRRFLLSCVQRNRNAQLRQRALAEIAVRRDAEGFDAGGRDHRHAGRARSAARAPARCCRRSPSAASAAATRRRHGCGGWPSTRARCTRSTPCSAGRRRSGCSGLLVNSSGPAHGRNARRLVHAARKHDRRLAAALLAAALGHTPEAEEVLRGARNRMARKPSALARELVRNFPKGKRRRKQRNGRPDAARRGKAARNGAAAKSQSLARRKLAELEVKATGANGADTAGAPAVEDPEAARPADRSELDRSRRSTPARRERSTTSSEEQGASTSTSTRASSRAPASRWTSPASRVPRPRR